jgi:hypothetical protein
MTVRSSEAAVNNSNGQAGRVRDYFVLKVNARIFAPASLQLICIPLRVSALLDQQDTGSAI